LGDGTGRVSSCRGRAPGYIDDFDREKGAEEFYLRGKSESKTMGMDGESIHA
jgi:hypothetical protein